MIRQIRLLSRILLCNIFDINKIKYGKDKKEKFRYLGLLLIWIYLIGMMMWLLTKFFKAYCEAGMGFIIPIYMYVFVSIFALVLTFLKAGNVLFSVKDYDMLISLPVSKTAIVVSRFFTMYVSSLLTSLIVIIPGMGVYIYYMKPELTFYLVSIVAVVFLPLLPLTLASIAGAMITAISARMKNKSLAEIILVFLLMFGIMYVSGKLSGNGDEITPEMMMNIATFFNEKIKKLYMPAGWYGEAINGNMTSFALLITIPLTVFIVFTFIVGRYFQSICSSINAVSAKNDYRLKSLNSSSVLMALWKKEMKRYFSSSVYVTNTIVCYVMGAVMCVALLIVGKDKVLSVMGLSMFVDKVDSFIPILIAFIFSISTTTAASISMEGKNLWQIKILPVRSIDVYNSKLLVNLSVAAPFYLVGVVATLIAIKPDIFNGVMIVLFPLCSIVFVAVLGLTINIHFPSLKWDNEVTPVKQGVSSLITMALSLLVLALPFIAMYFLKKVDVGIILVVTLAIMVCGTFMLYFHISHKKLMDIE